jgi:hypothetical protein
MDFKKYENQYKFGTSEYVTREGQLHQDFREDALNEVGMLGHAKADKLYSMAWEHGHSAGFSEVFFWVQDLARLLRDDP